MVIGERLAMPGFAAAAGTGPIKLAALDAFCARVAG
jgi:alpha-glucosidase